MSLISYAQNLEDVMLWRALRYIEKGFYIDVGAQDPLHDSVTKCFYENGWSGLNCEPCDKYFQMLRASRQRDINLKIIVGRTKGSVLFHEFDATGNSTTVDAQARIIRDAGNSGRTAFVPSNTLDNIMNEHGIGIVHFLKIDVEGMELEVLEGMSLVHHRPWIVIVEVTKPNSPELAEQAGAITVYLAGKNYEKVYFDGLNYFFLSEEHRDLREAFSSPPNCFDNFVPYRELQLLALIQENGNFEELVQLRKGKENTLALAARARLHAEKVRNEVEQARKYAESQADYFFRLTGKRETEIAAMRSSLSWRITAPLRALHNMIPQKLRERSRVSDAGSGKASEDPFAWTNGYSLQRTSGPLAFDVSCICQKDNRTGVQRVVRNIVTSLLEVGREDIVAAVDLRNGAVHDVSRAILDPGRSSGGVPRSLHEVGGLVMLDSTWDIYPQLVPLFQNCHRAGIEVITCVYDLIPIDFPATCHQDMPGKFKRWLDEAIEQSDAFICISEATARRLQAYIQTRPAAGRNSLKIGWWPLGVDITMPGGRDETLIETRVLDCPYVLVVGTLEPRKNHAFVLDAFEFLWNDPDFPFGLVFVGKSGWNVDQLEDRINSSPHRGDRLIWINNASDAQLKGLYRNCSTCVMASQAEGFGLPVVEAARYNKSIVLSDIPVFREIVVRDGYFFKVGNISDFQLALRAALSLDARPTVTLQTTWRESSESLMELIKEGNYQIRIA